MTTTNSTTVAHNGNNIPVKTNVLKVGTSFEITHCDGYVAKETVCKVEYVGEGNYYIYVCESCAVYSESDLVKATKYF